MKNGMTFDIWHGKLPFAKNDGTDDNPTLTAYLPEKTGLPFDGMSMLVFPGGGYCHLAPHEGDGYARWFASIGISAFVLSYRLGSKGYKHPAMIEDAKQAMRMVKRFVKENGLSDGKTGVIGSSAGGHLAATLLTKYDVKTSDVETPAQEAGFSARPDFGVLCYPVISFQPPYGHEGCLKNLVGENAPLSLQWALSAEMHVSPETPPCFIWHTAEDGSVPVRNSIIFAEQLAKAKIPFDLHIYEKGRHGIGLDNGHLWTDNLVKWLGNR